MFLVIVITITAHDYCSVFLQSRTELAVHDVEETLMDIPPLAVSVGEACRLIGCGRSKFYGIIKDNEIAVIKIGRRTLVPVAALRAFVETKMKEAA